MATPEIIQRPDRDQLGEAPFWDVATRTLFWADIVGKHVHRLDPATGEIRSWTSPQFCSAAVPTERGDVILSLRDGLYRLDLESGEAGFFCRPDEDAGNRSNECRPDPQGRLWLGTMANNLAPTGAPIPLTRSSGGIFRVEHDGSHKRLLSDIGIANILCWSPDHSRFYTADTKQETIWVFDYDPDEGGIHNRRVFAHGGPGKPDGASMDEAGCLWGARWGGSRVVRITPKGEVDLEIELPVKQPSSCAFGGEDMKTLYITSARQELQDLAPDSLDGALFAVRVETAGMPLVRFKG